jgi:hypothetical protein
MNGNYPEESILGDAIQMSSDVAGANNITYVRDERDI